MRTIAAIVLLAVAASALTDAQQWAQFKLTYGRKYATNGEEAARFAIFRENLRRAEVATAKSKTATFGVTKFMDITAEEFKATYLGLNTTSHAKWISSMPKFTEGPAGPLGTDWVAKKLVPPVQNQASCGSCWAFSATEGAEGCYAVKYGKALSLSAQQTVDCCTAGGSDGCNGGWHDVCVEYMMTQNIATWKSYPYTAYKGSCQAAKEVGLPKGTCDYYSITYDMYEEQDPLEKEELVQKALTHSTVPIAVDASMFQIYSGGIIDQCDNWGLNHAVLLVSDEGEGDSYVIKNSWADDWGEAGYVRIAKGVNCLGFTDRTCVAY